MVDQCEKEVGGRVHKGIERLESVYLLNLRQIRLLALLSVWEHGMLRIDAILCNRVAFVQDYFS